MRKFLSLYAFLLMGSFVFGNTIDLDGLGWPKELKFKKGTVSIYQPQIEVFKNNTVEARAALSAKANDKSPVFGAMWFSARVSTDTDERLVTFNELQVEGLKFPEGDEEKAEKIKNALTEKLSGLTFTMSLDRFTVSMEQVNQNTAGDESYKNTPPDIYFESDPAVLVLIDGDPILKEVENSDFKYVMNTPYFLVQHPKDKQYYMKGGKWWYASNAVEKGWKTIDTPPKDVIKLADEAFKGADNDTDSMVMELKQAPKVIVSTKPAELIQTDGEPKFEPVTDADLLFLTNSENDILMDIATQQYYILISGRWYTSKDLKQGPWSFVAPDKLPESFAKIPESSDIANVRYSVPGTQESKDALLENAIPQTAEVDRKTASVEVKYDGNPKFKKIESTKVSYAENADKTVLLIDQKYYCVDDAIWFVASKATGPWEVCVEVPEEVNDIPPSAPVYNVRYVYVYDYTPSVVYVGYTPGYYGSYIYHGTIIYGTGYWYRPWYMHYYYPRPVTWGFGVHYNPWTGWGFSFGVSYGWVSFGWHSYYNRWWGPCGYRYGYRHGYYRGYGHGYRHGYYHGYTAGRRAGYVAGHRAGVNRSLQSNIYRNRATGIRKTGVRPATMPSNRSKVGTRPSTRPSTRPTKPSAGARPSTRPATPKTRDNNVFSDKNGNIYRRDNSGQWQQRNKGTWNAPSRGSSGVPQNMNRDYNRRNYGNQRTNSYNNRSRQAAPRGRSGGGRRH